MAIKINNMAVQESYMEYGIVLVPGTILECTSEEEAIELAGPASTGIDIVARTVYETAWACVDETP